LLRLGIAGGGIGGSALISLLRGDPNTHLVGIYENKHEAPGVVLARKWSIPVFVDLESFVTANPDVVVNVTGDTEISNKIRAVSNNRVEVIEGVGARFLWEIIEKQKRAKIEVIKTMSDQKILYGLAAQLCSSTSLSGFFEIILAKALDIVDAPAGSLAVYEGSRMKLVASKGLSKRFVENNSWDILPGGITEQVFHTKEYVEITDALNCNYTNNPALMAEKIKSLLALPVLLRGEFAGILYIDDFKPRQFSERQKASLALLTGIVAVTLDRFALLNGLEEYRVKFSSLVESSNDILLMTNSKGFVITCNESATFQFGYSRDELIGKMITSLVKNGDTAASIKNLFAQKTPLTGLEVTVIDAKNREFEVKLNAAPLYDKGDSFLGMIYVMHSLEKELDLKNSLEKKTGELEELNANLEKKVFQRTDELEKTNRELERMNQLKGRFIANISHELRTPLNSILGFSDILVEKTFGSLNENQERYIRNIYSAGKHLLELINNVLDIAKIEAGKYEMIYETFRVNELIEDVLNIMRPFAETKFIGTEVQMGEDIDLMTGDRVKIKQVLYNLLSNAIKFTPEGGKVGIRVDYVHNTNGHHISGSEEKVDFLSFSVNDNGVGIGPEDKDRIFDEFEQVDTTLSREYGGAGLGLALSKKLVSLHGGNISVESNLGEGSTFTFTIPVTSAVESVEVEEPEAISLNFPWMKEEAPLILVVEDDPATAELLTLHLTQAGYKVAHAYNGEEAIQKAKTMRPFAITLDVMLPKKDGWEVLQALKGESSTAEIPVIIHSIVDNKELAFALGAADYLMKPLDKSALLHKLEEINIARGKIANPTSILVIESDEGVIEYFKEILEPQGFFIHTASTGKRGIELAHALRPSVILMDFVLTDMGSFDVIKELKENPYTKHTPIFILTERDISVEDRMTMMGNIERIVSKQAFDAKELIDHIKELEMLFAKRAGLIDDLTGVFSHRYFQIRLAQEVERASRYKLPLNLVLLDIDFFGNYVEGHGGDYGNTVLKKVSELLRKNIRGSDVVVRYGGDAFAVILPNTVISAGLALSNRFNAIIKNYPFLFEESQPKGRITASVGIVFLDGQATEELILCAEQALAAAIMKGGDRVEVYSSEQDEAAKVSTQ
jgi:diguanylate cyclase (GGDEF)-like protein/PAS domain S-box-containing protein